ncbi:MAG TPA: DNA-binding domain-containing protein, partial [Bdellovibrionales bacterium]|nr:DNA-binding domain-containing protein [Bdellovibrionales bacterium]
MRDLQRDIGAAIREGRVPEELVARLKPGGRLTLRAALGVYSGGYVARLTEALGETFEAVWWVLGDREFFALAKAFIAGNDSRTYNLSSYGEAFPAYLRHAGPPSAPFLHDLARFEWLFRESFNEPPPAPFDHAELHLLHERSDVVLKFQKNVRLFSAPYSVYPI